MTSKELRQKYIDFYKRQGHMEIPSASLIPENDPSVLFTTAGMHPLVPFLLGEKHPAGKKLVNVQKCVRTGDIDEVGDKVHHTFFEMLGHWSLGDYFKEIAIKMSYDFVVNELGLDKEKLAVSVFGGDKEVGFDEVSFEVWRSLGIAEERIAKLGRQDNWWETGGESGPCGPDTEMFYWTGEAAAPESFNPDDKRWVEIGNDVIMEYEKQGPGKYVLAPQKNIDNGTGLERLTAVINGLDDNYLTDLFKPIIEKIEALSGKKYGQTEAITRSMRIIADHLRAATFIMGDDLGVAPSNVDQGYVVRKLIRRAIRHGKMIGIEQNFTDKIGRVVIELMGKIYPELEKNRKFVLDNLAGEEEKFILTLQKGLKVFKTNIKALKILKNVDKRIISGKLAFDLYQTYGFPLELIKELANEQGFSVNEDEFNKKFKEHQQKSRTAAAGKFKGGLGAHSEQAIRYHTATHLLQAALRQVLGPHVAQRGSNITDERLRFDFTHGEKMTEEEKKQVEQIVNQHIQEDLPVSYEELTVAEAKAKGAIGLFEHKYGDKVKVYTIGDQQAPVSREICGGPHVKRTGELGHFRIKKEESSSAGVRRIKAVLE